jgi:hypothetical protein
VEQQQRINSQASRRNARGQLRGAFTWLFAASGWDNFSWPGNNAANP